MPIFYFHIHDNGIVEDPDGEDFADLAAARRMAIRAARELIAEKLRAGDVLDGGRIEISDANGMIIETVRLRDVLRLE